MAVSIIGGGNSSTKVENHLPAHNQCQTLQ
jgi:hypothetical protein